MNTPKPVGHTHEADHDNSFTQKHSKPIMPNPQTPYTDASVGVEPMRVVPCTQFGGDTDATLAQGYAFISAPKVARGLPDAPPESHKAWKPKGRK